MSNLDTVIKDLVIANRILAREEVVDAYGHVSIRNPDNPKHFFLSRSVSPELVERDDIVELGLDGQPVRDEKRALYLERFIHAAIYEARPDICQRFPHLVRGQGSIASRMWQFVDRACYCPIVYNSLEAFKDELRFRR